jgi:hypothetical protein
VAASDEFAAWDVRDALDDLAAKSMVVLDDGPDGTTRFRLLETLRQYALERLDETSNVEDYRRRYAEHYARFAEAAGPGLEGPDEAGSRASTSSPTSAPWSPASTLKYARTPSFGLDPSLVLRASCSVARLLGGRWAEAASTWRDLTPAAAAVPQPRLEGDLRTDSTAFTASR